MTQKLQKKLVKLGLAQMSLGQNPVDPFNLINKLVIFGRGGQKLIQTD